MIKRGYFITLEGVEGTGKSTHIEFVTQYLRNRGERVLSTREPGGTPIGEEIRELLLASHLPPMDAYTELLLMFAARVEHVSKVIRPALAEGKCVVSDRFYDASYAYQGYGRNVDLDQIYSLQKITIGDLQPDLTILLDVSLSVSMERVTERGNPDRFEKEQNDFHRRVRNGYLEWANKHQQRICVIDANQSIDNVQKSIETKLTNLFAGER